jgi:hypothetical protein
MTDTTASPPVAPEQGQLVHLRNRFGIVQDVTGYQPAADGAVTHRVALDHLGEALDVIWGARSRRSFVRARDCLSQCGGAPQHKRLF